MKKTIQICGIIGWDSSPESLRSDLADANGGDVELEISSPGGFIAPGLEMFNLIRNYAGNIDVRITGYAMSMASYIPLAVKARKNPGAIRAEENAVFMIHNARGIVGGDHNDVLDYGAYLKGLSGVIAKRYVKRTGKSLDEIRALMDKETFLFGDEMVAAGFVDELIEPENDDGATDCISAVTAARAVLSDCYSRMIADQAAARADWHQAAAMLGDNPEAKVGSYSASIELRDEAWSKSESESRWRDHAGVSGTEDLPNATYSKRFAYVSDNKQFTGHHFPIMDYRDGEFVNVAAVRNGLARLPQSNSVPSSDKPAVERLLRKYLDRYNKSKGKGEHQMNLQEFLAANPAARAEYDAAIAAARTEGETAMKATVTAVAPFLTSKDYPPTIAATAVKVLTGEVDQTVLSACVAAVDAVKEQQAGAAAGGEQPGDTPGQAQVPGTARKPGDPASTQEHLDEEVARFNKEVR